MLPASGLRLLYASRGSGTHRSSLLFLVRRLCLYPLQRGHDHEYTAADHRNLHRSSLSLRLNKGGRPPAPPIACQKVALPPLRRSCGLLRALAVRLRRTSGTLTGQEAFAPTHMSPEQTDWTGFAPVPQGHFRACSAGLGTGANSVRLFRQAGADALPSLEAFFYIPAPWSFPLHTAAFPRRPSAVCLRLSPVGISCNMTIGGVMHAHASRRDRGTVGTPARTGS